MNTVKEAKAYLKENFIKGIDCPCCGQLVKLYKRKLNSNMAYVLIQIFHSGKDFIHVKDYLRENNIKNTHDWTLLKHWGLIQERACLPEETGKKNSGFWRITKVGVWFVLGESEVSKHILIYNNKFQGFSDETTTITHALGDSFNYYELMKEEL